MIFKLSDKEKVFMGTSPRSAICRLSNGAAPVCKLYGRIIALSCRICLGPKRVPDLQLVPISIGTPIRQTSKPSGLLVSGNRIKVWGPENLAISFPEIG